MKTSPTEEEIKGWVAGRLPEDWYAGAPEISLDDDEILIVGPLSEPELPKDASAEARDAAREARIQRFREDTRGHRMKVADEAQRRFDRKVSWGATLGDERKLFTTLGVPVMTRLRLPERGVLDTLIAAGVARSRSEALAWCVRLVGKNESDWIQGLRDAFAAVEKVRAGGPRP